MSQRIQMRLATTVIVLVLGLQFGATILQSAESIWPFTNYPMYSGSHYEGDRIIARRFIHATTEDGEEVELTLKDIGVNVWLYEKWAQQILNDHKKRHQPKTEQQAQAAPKSASPIIEWLKPTAAYRFLRDIRHAMIREREGPTVDLHANFLQIAEEKLGAKIVRLRVEDTAYVVTRAGMADAPPAVVLVDLLPDVE